MSVRDSETRTPAESAGGRTHGRRRRRGVLLAGCVVLSGGLWVASRSADFVEQVYAENVGPVIARALGNLSGLVPLSLAEIVVFGMPLWLTLLAVIALTRVVRGKRRLLPVVLGGLLRLGVVVAVTATLFYALWGVQYARAPLDDRLGWNLESSTRSPEETDGELRSLCAELVDHVNHLHEQLHGGPAERRAVDIDIGKLNATLDASFQRLGVDLGLHASFGEPRGPAKAVVTSKLMSLLGLSGFYFPWTGEANYNDLVPLWQRVHAIAHEKSHQRGVMSEDEANFFGFLACIAARDPFIEYCGYLFGQRHLLRELSRRDQEAASVLVARRHPGVQQDVNDARAFWEEHRGWAMEAATEVNDQFLKLHRVEGGIESYGRVVRLLVKYARSRSGTLLWKH